MLYLYIALYAEAKEVIRRLGLKRKQAQIGFEVYEDEQEQIRLILMGTGALPAATAVGSSLSFFRAGERDMLINFGSCAAERKPGEVYLCHKLIDRSTGRSYYPDMLFRSSLPEAVSIMEPNVWKGGLAGGVSAETAETCQGLLHDMEGAAVFAAGSYFLAPHQMHFMKVVSDDGTGTVSAAGLSEITAQASGELIAYMKGLMQYIKDREKNPVPGRGKEKEKRDRHCASSQPSGGGGKLLYGCKNCACL